MNYTLEKFCTKCETYKPLTEFYKNKSRKDGYNGWCKACLKKPISQHKKSAKYKIQQSEYSKRADVRDRQNYMRRKRRIDNPEKYRKRDKIERQNCDANKIMARQAVGNAIRYHNFPKPTECQCEICNNQATEYHHPNYDKSDWLNVIPVCKKCHADIHNV